MEPTQEFSMNCPKPKHKNQPIVSVCMDPTCWVKEPLCCFCKEERHQNHETIEMDILMKHLKNAKDSKDKTVKENIIKELVELEMRCSHQLMTARQRIIDQLSIIQQAMVQKFTSIREMIEIELKRSEEPFAHHQLSGAYDSFCQEIIKQIENLSKFELTKLKMFSQIRFTVQQLDKLTANIGSSLIKLQDDTKNATELLSQLSNIFLNFNYGQVFPIIDTHYRWSIKNKFKSIQINKDTVVICKDGSILALGLITPRFIKEQVSILMDNLIDMDQNVIYNWAIKITKLHYTISIGICSLKSARMSEFQKQNWEKTGHGNYVISNNKEVHSHTDDKINNKLVGFEFVQGDVIKVDLNVPMRRITFTKGTERFQMEIQETIVGDAYVPCVYLTRTDNVFKNGEAVEIVQNKIHF